MASCINFRCLLYQERTVNILAVLATALFITTPTCHVFMFKLEVHNSKKKCLGACFCFAEQAKSAMPSAPVEALPAGGKKRVKNVQRSNDDDDDDSAAWGKQSKGKRKGGRGGMMRS